MPCHLFGVQPDPCSIVLDKAWDIGMVQRPALHMATTPHRLKQWAVRDPRRIEPYLKTLDRPDNTAVQDRNFLPFSLLVCFGMADGEEHVLFAFLCGLEKLNVLYVQAAYLRTSQGTREADGNNSRIAPSDSRISTLGKHGLDMVLPQCFCSAARRAFESGQSFEGGPDHGGDLSERTFRRRYTSY